MLASYLDPSFPILGLIRFTGHIRIETAFNGSTGKKVDCRICTYELVRQAPQRCGSSADTWTKGKGVSRSKTNCSFARELGRARDKAVKETGGIRTAGRGILSRTRNEEEEENEEPAEKKN